MELIVTMGLGVVGLFILAQGKNSYQNQFVRIIKKRRYK